MASSSNVFAGAAKKLSIERRVPEEPFAKKEEARGGTLGRRRRASSKTPSKLSGGSFKGKFGTFEAKDRLPPRPDGIPTSLDSSSASSLSSSASTASKSSLNRIANSASNFQTYASRYIESIRPKSWGKSGGSSNLLGPPVHSLGLGGKSPSESRAESPLGGIPHLLIFRSPPGRSTSGEGGPSPRLSPIPRKNNLPKSSSLKGDPRWFKHITEANNAFSSRDESQRSSGDRSGTDLSSQNGPLDGSSQPGGASNDLLGGPGYEGGKAAGRSESFKGSKTEGDRGSNEESVNKKTGGGTTSQSNDPANTSSSGQRKRLQRVEILKIAEPCPLIDPSQVVVTQGEIFMAEPILTPIEKLRRKDLEVARALEEKKQLIAEILNVPKEHFDDIADIASSQPSQDKDAREVLLAALAQAKCLSDLVNQSLNLSDEERILVGSEVSMNSSYTRNTSSSSISTREQQRPLSPSSGISGDLSTAGSGPSSLMSSKPSSSNLTTRNLNPLTLQAAGKFVSISVNLNSHLTTLLGMIQERDEERERMKQELQRSKEQVHAYLSQSTSVVTSSMSAVSPGSRPASFISVEESSGTGDLSEKGTQESGGEDDGALPTNMYENISSSDQDLPEPVTPTNAKPMEDPPASSSDDSPSSPGPYTSLNKEESLENSPSDSDKTVTESTPTYNAEAQSLIESDPGPDVSEDSARANATSSSSTSPVQKTEE